MSNANKNKGKGFERELAKHLTEVFGLNFNRVPNSGAFTGGKNAFRTAQLTSAQQLLTVGDVIPPENLSSYSWEAKFYQSFPFNTLFTENATLDKWLEQAKCPNRYWFLVFKINHCGAFVAFDPSLQPYKIDGNSMLYKDNVIVKMEGFFEANKEMMLAHNKPLTKRLDPDKDDISKFSISLEQVNKNADLIGKDLTLPNTGEFTPP